MIIPAIDLIDGKVVRLYQGDYQQTTQFDLSPLSQLKHYESQGAKWLHLVDLSGARNPAARQSTLIKKLAGSLTTKLQVGGGIRTEKQIEELLEAGVNRVVIGSLAVREPQKVMAWIKQYGNQAICLALDVNLDSKGRKILAVSGWQESTGEQLETFIEPFLAADLKHALVTDISRDGTLTGANTSLYNELSNQYPQIQWQASGGIANLADVAEIRDSGASGIIIGKALLLEHFTVQEAITCWPNA